MMRKRTIKLILFVMLMLSAATLSLAQNTDFTYQGKLTDSAGSGPYDFQFNLCATESAPCSPPVNTYSQSGVTLSPGGVFSVTVIFTSGFDGSDRYLEVAARRTGETSYTTLTPRQKVTMAPYARYSVDTAYFNNLPLEEFVLKTDPQIQPNYNIRNTTVQQAGVNFNIGGNGTIAGSLIAATGTARVGIGTTSPTNKLQVSDQSNTGLRVTNAIAGGTVASFGSNGEFQIDTSNIAGGRFAVLENGNVGIGNPSPAYKFDILNQTASGFRVRNGNAGGTLASFGANGAFQVDSGSGAGGRFSILENGNVGIGNNNPLYRLSVSGTDLAFRVDKSNVGGTLASFGSSGNFRVDSTVTSGGRFTILENGNVGINDANPDAKLSISGTGSASTALEIDNGAIKVTGPSGVAPAFTLVRTTSNSCGDWISIDSPYSNNNPNAMVFVTPVNPARNAGSFITGVYYETNFSTCPQFNNKWAIIAPGSADFNPTLKFNILIINR